jgi:hypothetical protein
MNNPNKVNLNIQELNLKQRRDLNITSTRDIPFHLKHTTLEKEVILKQLTYITLILYEEGCSLFAIDPTDFVEVDRTLFLTNLNNVGKVDLVNTYKEIGKFAYTLFTGKVYKKETDLDPLKGTPVYYFIRNAFEKIPILLYL